MPVPDQKLALRRSVWENNERGREYRQSAGLDFLPGFNFSPA